MGDIATSGAAAFRDYVTDGVPSSGINSPLKGDVRDLFDDIDALTLAFQDSAGLYWDDSTKQLGFNTNAPAAGAQMHFVAGGTKENVLLLNHNLTNPAYEPRSLSSVLTSTFSADNSHDQLAMFGTLFVNPGTHTQSASHNAGNAGGGYGYGAGTVTKVSGVFGNSGNQGAGVVTNAHDFYSRTPINSGGGTVTNYWGYYQEDATGTAGVSNLYGIRVVHPSLFGGTSAPTLGYQLEVRGALLTLHGASSVPPNSGTALGNGLQQTWDDNSGAAMFAYGNGGSGYHLLVSDKGSLGVSYPLFLQTNGGKTTTGGLLQTTASASGSSGLNLPHGAAPSAPVNGDVWTTTAGLFVRVNGSTVGPLS